MLKKETIAQIILGFQKEELSELIPRKLKVDLEIPLKRAITIICPRRSGKTYYFYYLIKKLLKRGILKKESFI